MRFQSVPGLDIIAPGLIEQAYGETEAFGAATWLWMQADTRRDLPLHWLASLLLPAIEHRQFLIASSGGIPVFYLSWACFNEAAERRYLNGPPQALKPVDWLSGDRLWIIDWVAPFGHTGQLAKLMRRQLFAHRCVRMLYHRGNERGLKVKQVRGSAVDPVEARAWFRNHPPGRPRHAAALPAFASARAVANPNGMPDGLLT